MRREGWLWGSLLAVSLALGTAALSRWIESGEAEPAPEPMRLDDPRISGRPMPPPLPALPAGFTPDLPEVPALPPGTRLGRGRAPAASADDQLAAEMRLLQEAQRITERDPAGALALLEQHRARYPRGTFREEREAYAIEALVRLEHTSEVERRYLEFRADFPSSTFLVHLEQRMR